MLKYDTELDVDERIVNMRKDYSLKLSKMKDMYEKSRNQLAEQKMKCNL